MKDYRRSLIPIAICLNLFNSSQAADYQPRETLREETHQRELYQDTNIRDNYQR